MSEYRYNALGYRIAWHYDVTSVGLPFGEGGADGSVNDTDPWYFFAYNDSWQKWGVIRGMSSSGTITLDANPKELFVHHKAGAGGFGGGSYIDSVLLRERDTTPEWRQAADSTRDETLYYVQNWRADVIGLASSQGGLVDHVRYSPYGVPTRLNPADVADDAGNPLSSSSGVNSGANDGDYNYFFNEFLSNGAGADIGSATTGEIFPGGDGVVDSGDYNLFFNEFFVSYARGQLTADGVANRLGYAGYEFDPVLIGSGSGAAASDPTCFYHVRHRVYDSQNGRWTRRDPLGYVDGMGLYEYCMSEPTISSDPTGLMSMTEEERCCDTAAKYHERLPRDDPWYRDRSMYSGATVCCNGKPLLCISKRGFSSGPKDRRNRGKHHPKKNPNGMTDKMWLQERIETIVWSADHACLLVHESQHANDALLLGKCAPGYIGRVPFTTSELACSECRAYTAERDCLSGRMSECAELETMAREMGLDKPEQFRKSCEDQLQSKIDHADREAQKFCKECDDRSVSPRPCRRYPPTWF